MSLIIAIKRKNSNSKLLYKPKYLLAKDFNLSPVTFSKYLHDCVSLGWITLEKDGYKAKKLYSIFKEINSEHGIYFFNHRILKNKNYDFKSILKSVEQFIVADNTISKQEYMIAVKRRGKSSTGQCAGKNLHKPIHTVKTSARNVSRRTGFSIAKSNAIMNRKDVFERKERYNIFIGMKSSWDLEYIKAMFPKSHVFYSNKHKACVAHHGSSLILIENKTKFGIASIW